MPDSVARISMPPSVPSDAAARKAKMTREASVAPPPGTGLAGAAVHRAADKTEEISLSDMIKTLRRRIFEEKELSVLVFFEEMQSRRELVTAFIAVLEIVRTESVKLTQKQTFGDIILKAVTNGTGN